MSILVILPILIPFTTGIVGLLVWNQRTLQRRLSIGGAVALFCAGLLLLIEVVTNGIQVMQSGNWPAPFGITLVADLFSAIMVMMAGTMLLMTVVYALVSTDAQREAYGFHPMLHFLLVGVCGAFLTGDIFNLYVWYEVMLIASFVLLVLGGERAQLEGGIKYVTLNLMASSLFLAAIGLLYGVAGTLNMAHLHEVLPESAGFSLSAGIAMLFLFAFGIKSALFPLFFWLPASYHTPPIAVTVIFSALLTKVGIYSLVRVFTLVFHAHMDFVQPVLLSLAALTMITGVLGAVAQYEMRRLLSFHIISQIGYLLMGLGLFSVLGLASTIFFLVHVILAKSALFLVGGVLHYLTGTYDLKKLGGFYRTSPMMATLFAIPAFSLSGIPPFSGFWAKFGLVRAGLEAQQYLVVAAALGVGILTMFSMTKIWNEAFLKEQPDGSKLESVPLVSSLALNVRLSLVAPIAVIAVLMVVIGVFAEPVFALSIAAAEQLLDPVLYVEAVLGGSS